jgi:DNA-binding HxlR family transcriptional regulator
VATRSVLRDATFLRLWAGTTASGLATWALPFLLGLAVLDHSLSPAGLGTWSVVVVFALREGPLRYAELLERIGGISKKVLTQTLRRLEGSGLVRRRAIRSAPPGAEYALTTLGESLLEPVTVLARWAEQHAEQVAAAREGTP